MRIKQRYQVLLISLVTVFLLAVSVIGGWGVLPAFADTTANASVLSDLQKDNNFAVADYPIIKDDYSIQVIQIAESSSGELYVYTYQPCQNTRNLTATRLNMSLTDKRGGVVDETELSEEDKPKLYNLTLLSFSGVFCKYAVRDFTISKDLIRCYNVATIYRAFDSDIDAPIGNNNTINDVAYPVNTLYKAGTINGTVVYSYEQKNVIRVVDKYVGMLRYTKGILFGVESQCDSHYIAFSTDMQIDDLVEATVYFTTQKVTHYYTNNNTVFGDPEENYVSITADETVSSGTFGLYANVHLWNRIQTVDEFCAGGELNEDAFNEVKNKQWVLRFVETDYGDIYSNGGGYRHFVNVANTAILELTFYRNGECYSVGVIDNIQTGSNTPDNPDTGLRPPWESDGNESIGFWEYIWRCIVRLFSGTASFIETVVAVATIFVVVAFLPILMLVLSIIFPAFRAVLLMVLKAIGTAILWLLKGLLWLICFPFRCTGALIRKIKGG